MPQAVRAAVLGGGNAAFALAAGLAQRGVETALYELPEFAPSIAPIQEQGGIVSRGVVGDGLARLRLATTDIAAAIDGARTIFVCVPAYGQLRMAQVLAPVVQPDQVIVLLPGNTGGSLVFARELSRTLSRLPRLAEGTSCIFAGKKDGPGGVWARGVKRRMQIAAFPARATEQVMAVLAEVLPLFKPAANVLETGLSNTNHIVHPPPILLNAARVERTNGFWSFFLEGVTPAVGRFMDALDDERLTILGKLGLLRTPTLELLIRYYGEQGFGGPSLYEAFRTTPVHGPSAAPSTLRHRYIVEDVPYGLVPMASIGQAIGCQTLTLEAAIHLAGVVTAADYRRTGWTLTRLGLDGMTAAQMITYVTEGYV